MFRSSDHCRIYIYLVVDNFSRCILSCKASLSYSAKECLDNLNNAVALLPARPDFVLSDDGSENVLLKSSVPHLIAQKDITFSNSMVEAVFKHLKYYYLFPAAPGSFAATVSCLERAVLDYNNKPHGELAGLSPLEVFNGLEWDKEGFAENIRIAKKERIRLNGEGCGKC